MALNLAELSPIYAENSSLNKEDVNSINEWIKSEKYLPELSELQIILFLHSCSCKIEETKKTIINYFTCRTNNSLFQTTTTSQLKQISSLCFTGMLPKKTPEGYVIWLFKHFTSSAEFFNCTEIARLTIMNLCLYFHQHGPANGLLVLCDMNKFSFRHLFKIQITIVKQFLYFLQQAVPVKIKGLHCLNPVPVTKHLIILGKPFIKKEIFEMLQLHDSLESLYQYISQDCLPNEYGGKIGTLTHLNDQNVDNLIQNSDFFRWHEQQKIDQSQKKKLDKRFFHSIQSFF